jgi:hypothetical protein
MRSFMEKDALRATGGKYSSAPNFWSGRTPTGDSRDATRSANSGRGQQLVQAAKVSSNLGMPLSRRWRAADRIKTAGGDAIASGARDFGDELMSMQTLQKAGGGQRGQDADVDRPGQQVLRRAPKLRELGADGKLLGVAVGRRPSATETPKGRVGEEENGRI